MKNARNSIIALALTALSAGSVFAADMTPKTRDQVRAELVEAQRNGTMIFDGETGATFREKFPTNYPMTGMQTPNTTRNTTVGMGQSPGTIKAN
jgi:Domain of unknown function (DUF4148)